MKSCIKNTHKRYMEATMLRVEAVSVSFKKEHQKHLLKTEYQSVLKDVSLSIAEGRCLGLLGESGSGKSTLARVVCGLLKPDSGHVIIHGQNHFLKDSRSQMPSKVSIVFQNYHSSANPKMRVFDIIGESIKDNKAQGIKSALELVKLPANYVNRYPHELSGGQLQRVCIARAIATQSKLIILDEAVSALDAHTQVHIMDLLKDIQMEKHLTYMFITHDLQSIAYFCDAVDFLHEGAIVESTSINELRYIKHPYAKRLLKAVL